MSNERVAYEPVRRRMKAVRWKVWRTAECVAVCCFIPVSGISRAPQRQTHTELLGGVKAHRHSTLSCPLCLAETVSYITSDWPAHNNRQSTFAIKHTQPHCIIATVLSAHTSP